MENMSRVTVTGLDKSETFYVDNDDAAEEAISHTKRGFPTFAVAMIVSPYNLTPLRP